MGQRLVQASSVSFGFGVDTVGLCYVCIFCTIGLATMVLGFVTFLASGLVLMLKFLDFGVGNNTGCMSG